MKFLVRVICFAPMSLRNASRQLLLLDKDMDAMYLSDKKNGIEREDDHEELEVLLESFSKQVEEIVNEAENIEVSTCIPWYSCVG